MKKTALFGVIAAAGLAAAASAQDNAGYEIQITSDTNVLSAADPTATLTLSIGWFAPDGFGANKFQGDVTATPELATLPGAFVTPIEPIAPFGPTSDSGTGSTDGLLNDIDIFRFLVNQPESNPPAPYGLNEYIGVFTFEFTATDFSTETFVDIGAEGSGQNILAYTFAPFIPPGQWSASAWSAEESATADPLRLFIVPAPGAAALLGLGGLVATRRRRHA